MPAERRTFHDALEEFVYWDSSFAIAHKVEANRVELNRLTILLPITPAVQARAFALMRQHALLPTDAYHIAVALEAGVHAFATLDEDFLRVDGIIVYTCLP